MAEQRPLIFATPGNEIAIAQVGELAMAVYGSRQWSDTTWGVHCEQAVEQARLAGFPRGSLNYAPEQGPNARQRKQMTEAIEDFQPHIRRVTLLTNSIVIRGVLTAFGWLLPGPEFRVFHPDDQGACFDWLAGAVRFDPDEARERLAQLRKRVGLV
jgi:hypothetical protein